MLIKLRATQWWRSKFMKHPLINHQWTADMKYMRTITDSVMTKLLYPPWWQKLGPHWFLHQSIHLQNCFVSCFPLNYQWPTSKFPHKYALAQMFLDELVEPRLTINGLLTKKSTAAVNQPGASLHSTGIGMYRLLRQSLFVDMRRCIRSNSAKWVTQQL